MQQKKLPITAQISTTEIIFACTNQSISAWYTWHFSHHHHQRISGSRYNDLYFRPTYLS